jgi:uncharacterized protein YlxW (UPF0749 family)
VHANRTGNKFVTARQDQLVGVLDDLSQRSERLRSDIQDLQDTKASLQSDQSGATALAEARKRAITYGILAGTLPATGPGIELRIDDPHGKVGASVLLDGLEELRDAGAEVVQINDLRVTVSTSFIDAAEGGVLTGGQLLRPPYTFLAIGDPRTLATAMNIPGGVMDSVRGAGADGTLTQHGTITINAVRRG